jgi:hypothetical protein
MKNIDEALQLETEAELEVEIAERKELRSRMVGQLYPSILTDEIYKLNSKCWDIRHSKVLKT